MISLENAKRLWELGYMPFPYAYTEKHLRSQYTLSQLLEEVEKRLGYAWQMWPDLVEWIDGSDSYIVHYTFKTGFKMDSPFYSATTKEDAVALALISILEGEK